MTALLSVTGSLKIYLIILKTKTHTHKQERGPWHWRPLEATRSVGKPGARASFLFPACLRRQGGLEQASGRSCVKGSPNFSVPLFFRQPCSSPHRLFAKNKQRLGQSKAPCKLQVIKTACKCPSRKHFKETVIPALVSQDCVV